MARRRYQWHVVGTPAPSSNLQYSHVAIIIFLIIKVKKSLSTCFCLPLSSLLHMQFAVIKQIIKALLFLLLYYNSGGW